jgi:hypothetical protein
MQKSKITGTESKESMGNHDVYRLNEVGGTQKALLPAKIVRQGKKLQVTDQDGNILEILDFFDTSQEKTALFVGAQDADKDTVSLRYDARWKSEAKPDPEELVWRHASDDGSRLWGQALSDSSSLAGNATSAQNGNEFGSFLLTAITALAMREGGGVTGSVSTPPLLCPLFR